MQIARFLPTLHYLVKITCQLYSLLVHLVAAEQDVNGSQSTTSVYSSLWLTCEVEIECCLTS